MEAVHSPFLTDALAWINSGAIADRDGMVDADDGGWNATAYLWHLVDLARSWSERWVQVEADPGSLLAGWDPDVLAAARNYRSLPTAPASRCATSETQPAVPTPGRRCAATEDFVTIR